MVGPAPFVRCHALVLQALKAQQKAAARGKRVEDLSDDDDDDDDDDSVPAAAQPIAHGPHGPLLPSL